MTGGIKAALLNELSRRYGAPRGLERSQSLFDISAGNARIYIRYSKIHSRNQAFYGLRREDLQRLEGHPSVICFLWENQTEPLFVPYSEYEEVFQSISPAGDGQYKAQIYLKDDGTELYVAGAGRFNVDAHFGWDAVESLIGLSSLNPVPELSHSSVQTLLGAIGAAKGYDVWIPQTDRPKLEWSLTDQFKFRGILPSGYEQIRRVLEAVDVIWIDRGSSRLRALYEIEHSTPIYSGLLRFNDIQLVVPPSLSPRFNIVANNTRRDVFVHQIRRPTFQMSGLFELCSFLEYSDVYGWHNRIKSQGEQLSDQVEVRQVGLE